ncbi:hypothetical protein Ndes2437B_g00560 [Nannochloris sp. 'desiccata']
MSWVVLVLINSLLLAAAQNSMISSEGNPFRPVPAYEGFIVYNGHQIDNQADGSSFIAAPGKVAKTDSVIMPAANNSQPNVGDCSRSCAATFGCTVFMYCQAGDGPCPVTSGVVIPELGCGLFLQAEANPNMTVPFMTVQQETTEYLISGAPIVSNEIEDARPLPGFSQLFAQSFFNRYDFECEDTLIEGACALTGTPESLMSRCNEEPGQRCNLMIWYPGGRPDLGPNITFFKGGEDTLIDTSLANLNHHGIAYIRLGQIVAADAGGGSGGGLSDGAVAGVAIGSAAVGAVLAAAATFFALKRRHRGQLLQPPSDKGDVELQRPSIGGISQASTHVTSLGTSQAHSTFGSTPAGSGSSAAKSAAAQGTRYQQQQNQAPTVSPFIVAMPGETASKNDTFDAHRSPFADFTPFDSPLDGTGPGTMTTSNRPSICSSGGGTAVFNSGELQQPHQRTVISVLNSTDALHASSSTDPQHSRSVKSLDLGNPLETAASTATVLDAIKGAGWAHYSVPFDSIQWMRHPDGKLWELGHGAFSKVYKCSLDATLVFAAKVIPLEDANAERVFLREAITLFHLRHSNVVQFSAVCIHQKKGILLMELMEAGSLFDNIKLKSSTGVRVASWHLEGRRIALGIAQALHYLHHSLKVMHMDLKSANVLLTRDFTPKLADVGFSRVWASMDLSAKDSRIGTFAYMAPELLLGGAITSAADIYSFGVLLRELCTGEYPSRGRSRLPEVPHECPGEVVDVIKACMRSEPKDRPTAKDVHSMLLKCP